jgi:uncharacterized protein YndB with AHSA1/START domain
MSSQTLIFKRTVNASPAEAYRAFTKAIALREGWMCDVATTDVRVGGRLYLWWNSGYYTSGEFTALEPNKAVAFTWHGRGEPGATQVQVSLTPTEGGTEVTLTHSGFGAGPEWVEPRKDSEHGWAIGLENLQSVLETGQDLRFVRRPMLGINLGEFNDEIAAKLGVPVSEGICLQGVLEGMGAQAAGLQKDDVLVSLGGQATTDFPTLVKALQGRRAGETVEVVFYRRGEKKVVAMKLSPRPIPEVPPTPAALAEAMRKLYADFQAELTACLAGVSEAEAAHHPAPGAWNALETVGHLIAVERENQTWITDLLNDDERWSDRFENPTAVPARVGAIAAAYPTLAAIVEELQRSQAEVVAMLAALSPEFVAHKSSYWRLGSNLLQQPLDHVREHCAQIRAAVQAARGK